MQKAPQQQTQAPPRTIFKVFLTGIAVDFDKRELTQFFRSQYPSVIRVDLLKQKEHPELNRGFGFIELLNREEQQAILRQENFRFSGRLFSAKEHKKGKDLEKYKDAVERRRLFVCNVNLEVTDKELKTFFSEYAFIENAYLVNRKQYGASRQASAQPRSGFGYVVVRYHEDARKLLDIQEFWVRGRKAIVKPFNPKKHYKNGDCLGGQKGKNEGRAGQNQLDFVQSKNRGQKMSKKSQNNSPRGQKVSSMRGYKRG